MQYCSLLTPKDCVVYLIYYLTKALYEDQTTAFGSIVMNTNNESIGIKQLFESCFEATPSHIHHKTGHPHMANITIIGHTIDLFEKNTNTYMRHICNGTLIFTPKLGLLSETNHSMINKIKAAKPFSVSWVDVVDYIHPQSFHNIAKNMPYKDTA